MQRRIAKKAQVKAGRARALELTREAVQVVQERPGAIARKQAELQSLNALVSKL